MINFVCFQNKTWSYMLWIIQGSSFALFLILGSCSGILLDKKPSSVIAWSFLVCFVILVGIKLYFLILVRKFYNWDKLVEDGVASDLA